MARILPGRLRGSDKRACSFDAICLDGHEESGNIVTGSALKWAERRRIRHRQRGIQQLLRTRSHPRRCGSERPSPDDVTQSSREALIYADTVPVELSYQEAPLMDEHPAWRIVQRHLVEFFSLIGEHLQFREPLLGDDERPIRKHRSASRREKAALAQTPAPQLLGESSAGIDFLQPPGQKQSCATHCLPVPVPA